MDSVEFGLITQFRLPGKVDPVATQRRIEYNEAGDPLYIGFAPSGYAEGANRWYIEKLEYDESLRYAKSTFSSKTASWSNRATESYS